MAASQPDALPSNVSERRVPGKRKREVPSSRTSAKSTPNAYARRSPPREQARRPRSPSPIRSDGEGDRSPPRKLKRPGAGARRTVAERQAVEDNARRLEQDQKRDLEARQLPNALQVAEHYNAVPERGREWRKTESQIKGLRSLNNWVKSTLIQKFSKPTEYATQRLHVLDMACGKGGDLGKWEKAPQVPYLYVGCDTASVSIDQAQSRWDDTLRRSRGRHRAGMHAEFHVHDAFGQPLSAINTINEVGFNPHAGPGNGMIMPGGPSGGFDVVSMMFALHYSYESEDLAKGMLKNISGALRKGGRFFGVMPDSDVISATVKKLLQTEGKNGQATNGKVSPAVPAAKEKDGGEEGEVEDEWDPEKPADTNGTAGADDDNDDWDPEKPSEPPANGTATNGEAEEDDWDPEKPSEAAALNTADTSIAQANGTPAQQPTAQTPAASDLPPLEWGNSLYTVRFPRHQPLTHLPLPSTGTFRPPYGWRYHYQLEEAVDVPEYVVPWEAFRALAEDYGLELMYRKGFREILAEVMDDDMGEGADTMRRELMVLAERMGVLSRDRSEGGGNGLLVGEEELEAAGFYHGFCFYKI